MSNVKMNEAQFNTSLTIIKEQGEKFAAAIHESGLFALAQVNEHGNSGFAVRLLEAIGTKHAAKRVQHWLITFGKLQVKEGKLSYLKRQDITETNLDVMLEKADKTPYWELKAEADVKTSLDFVALLHSIIRKAEKAEQAKVEGKEVEFKNEAALAEIKALYAKFNVTPAKA